MALPPVTPAVANEQTKLTATGLNNLSARVRGRGGSSHGN
jgi:hypothetical protein